MAIKKPAQSQADKLAAARAAAYQAVADHDHDMATKPEYKAAADKAMARAEAAAVKAGKGGVLNMDDLKAVIVSQMTRQSTAVRAIGVIASFAYSDVTIPANMGKNDFLKEVQRAVDELVASGDLKIVAAPEGLTGTFYQKKFYLVGVNSVLAMKAAKPTAKVVQFVVQAQFVNTTELHWEHIMQAIRANKVTVKNWMDVRAALQGMIDGDLIVRKADIFNEIYLVSPSVYGRACLRWNTNATLRGEWSDDFDAYLESQENYAATCDAIGQAS